MKKWIMLLGCAIFVLFSWRAIAQEEAQEEPNLDMFYGSKDFGGAKIGYEYFLSSRGQIDTVNFNYLTKSKRAEHAETWVNYFGVSLEFAYGGGDNYHFPGKDRGTGNYDAYWFLLWLNERLYLQDTKKVRPYFDLAAGLGEGEIFAKGSNFDTDWTSLNLIRLKVGTGAEIMLSPKLGLDVGVDVNGSLGSMNSLFTQSDLTLVGAEATIGISSWTEKTKR